MMDGEEVRGVELIRKGDGLGKNKGKIKDKQLEIKEYPPC